MASTRPGATRRIRWSSSSNETGGLTRSAACSRSISMNAAGSSSKRLQRKSSATALRSRPAASQNLSNSQWRSLGHRPSRQPRVPILRMILHRRDERFVVRDLRFWKVRLHRRPQASRLVGWHGAGRHEVPLHLVQDLCAPAELPAAAARSTVSRRVRGNRTFASTTTVKVAGSMRADARHYFDSAS